MAHTSTLDVSFPSDQEILITRTVNRPIWSTKPGPRRTSSGDGGPEGAAK